MKRGVKKGYKQTKEHREAISRAKRGIKRSDMVGDKNPAKRPEVRKKISMNNAMKNPKLRKDASKRMRGNKIWVNRKHKESTKEIMSENQKLDKNSNWKGGCETTLHNIAWKLFGKPECEKCNIPLDEYMEINKCRFDMHNTLKPKDYTIMKQDAWMCLCRNCHSLEENDNVHI